MNKENHVTYSHKIDGIAVNKGTNFCLEMQKIEVRYSKSNCADTISFSDNENYLVQMRVDDLKEILDEYEQ